MLNSITVMGRLTRDPELRRTGSGVAVASFTLAVDDDYKNDAGERKTIFVDCVAWRHTAEFVSKYFTKGRMAVANGKLDIRNWTDKEGNKRKNAEIIVENMYFGDYKKNDDGNSHDGGYSSYSQPSYATPQYAQYDGAFGEIEGDDEQLPF